MKFGHDLARVVSVSDPEWAPFFIQYKFLKKCINAIHNNVHRGCQQDSLEELPDGVSASMSEAMGCGNSNDRSIPGQVATIAQSKSEVDFFRALRVELRKSGHFFKTTEQMLEIRRERISEALQQLRRAATRRPATKPAFLDEFDDNALSACVAYYRELLLLENYAIINYCGFSKILKKHDKRTGYDTRTRFMRVCVSRQPFTHYPRLLEMIKEAEELYRELAKTAAKSRKLNTLSHKPIPCMTGSTSLSMRDVEVHLSLPAVSATEGTLAPWSHLGIKPFSQSASCGRRVAGKTVPLRVSPGHSQEHQPESPHQSDATCNAPIFDVSPPLSSENFARYAINTRLAEFRYACLTAWDICMLCHFRHGNMSWPSEASPR
mmetsp:Transcript_545/g.1446  ORF Transcript_545/g.1446 Transcript_545/m.1446 type:complete len:378 (-) Transcript_545:435-1568(-)